MKNPWHELIQRYADGQATAEEAASLEEALKHDADLREWYLDVALAAAAEATVPPETEAGNVATSAQLPGYRLPRYGRWLAGAAASAGLIVFSLLLGDRSRLQPRPAVDAACSSTQAAIARLSIEPPPFPEWMSPTASLLEEPHFHQGDL